jgi:predicted flap endonuclease-1-like 5' DNA nuclease/predicted  nucleic acid-binding Zn-ribbon protein
MKWFFIQSLVALLAAFGLGVPIGYLMWRLQYRKVRTFDTTSSFANAGVSTDNALTAGAAHGIASSSESAILDAPSSVVSAPSVAVASGPTLERVRVEHAAEVGRLRTSLSEREASLQEIRVQLETSRKAVLERDSRISTFTASNPTGTNDAASATRLQALAEQRDAARAGLATALADYETRLAAFRNEHTEEMTKLRSDHAVAIAGINTDSEQRINEIRSERESAAQDLQKITAESDKQRAELQARHESAIADLRKRAERAEAELTAVRAELESQRAETGRAVGTVEADRNNRQAEFAAALAAAKNAESSLAEAVASRNELQRNLVDSSASLSRTNAELAEIRIELATVKTDLATSRTALDSARAAVLSAETDAKSLRSDLTRVEQQGTNVQTINAEFFSLKSAYESLRSEHAALQLRHQALVVEERALRSRSSEPVVSPQSLVAPGAPAVVVPAPSAPGAVPPVATANTPRMAVNLATVDADGQDAPGEVDDLERIEGIGPRIGASLQAVGIRTFARLAVAREERLRDALARAGLNLAPSLPTWSQQARFLALGDEASFRHLVDQLIAGREVK